MSNFTRSTINPATGDYEIATWLDDHYGPNRYGVRFPDGKIYPEEVAEYIRSRVGDWQSATLAFEDERETSYD